MTYAAIDGDSLADFLTRPRLISSQSWAVGSTLDVTILPWQAFFDNASVFEKMTGFGRFRGDLRVTIMINGSQFHAGVAYASYLPLGNDNHTTPYTFNDGVITTVTGHGLGCPNGATYTGFNGHSLTAAAVGARALTPLSQRQHIMLYPSESKGGQLDLPFIFPTEYVPIDNAFSPNGLNPTLTTTAAMGSIRIMSVGTLKFLGDNAPDAVDIAIYASLIPGYELCVPSLGTAQSGEAMSVDDRVEVDKPPTLSNWRDVVRAVGPSVARVMGFTNPPLLTNTDAVRVQNVTNLANTQLSSHDEVLAAHPGVTLASTADVFGDEEDSLSISSLVQRDSLLTAFAWPATGTGSTAEYCLMASHVTPMACPIKVWTGQAGNSYEQVFPTPMRWIGEAFKYWRGDMVYTIEVITTKFQKGRLKVSFVPAGPPPVGAFVDTVGRVMTKIIDISENNKVEFVVPYVAPTAWLATAAYIDDYTAAGGVLTTPSYYGATGETIYTYNSLAFNGSINVQVLNTLTNNIDATVLVHVRGGSNFEFAVPCGVHPSLSLQDQYFVQSGDVDDMYMGEKVKTIKDLMHRSTPMGFFQPMQSTLCAYDIPASGIPRGIGLNSADNQMRVSATLYGMGSAATHSFYHWFSAAFACARSSHRVTIGNVGSAYPYSASQGCLVTVKRGIDNLISMSLTNGAYTQEDFILRARLARKLTGLGSGSALRNMAMWNYYMRVGDAASLVPGDGGSVLVPYMSFARFSATNPYYDFYRPILGTASGSLIGEPNWAIPATSRTNTQVELGRFFQPVDVIRVLSSVDSRSGGALALQTAAGPDVALAHFCNAPTYFRSSRGSPTFATSSSATLNSIVKAKIEVDIAAEAASP